MRWRADAPIVDPVPVTRERVTAFSSACPVVLATVVPMLWAPGTSLPGMVHDLRVPVVAVGALAISRVSYRTALTRLDKAQVDPGGSRPRARADAVADAVYCGVVGVLAVWLGITGAGWAWISAVICAGLATAAGRDVSRGGGGLRRSPRGR